MNPRHIEKAGRKKTELPFSDEAECHIWLDTTLPELKNYRKYKDEMLLKAKDPTMLSLKDKVWLLKKCLATHIDIVVNSPVKLVINGWFFI